MKEVAFVGFAEPTRAYAPYDNLDIEIWSCNEGYQVGKKHINGNDVCFLRDSQGNFRADRWFQIHPREILEQNEADPHHIKWLQQVVDMPIYMYPKQEDIPASVEFPLDEIVDKYFGNRLIKGEKRIRLFSSTFDYMLALAIHENFDRVHVFGFEMQGSTEYYYQRPGAYLWLGIAISNNVQIVFHKESKFIANSLYGIEVNMIVDRNAIEVQADYITQEESIKIGELNKQVALREQAEAALRNCVKSVELDKLIGNYITETNKEKSKIAEAAWFTGQKAFAFQTMERMDMKIDSEIE